MPSTSEKKMENCPRVAFRSRRMSSPFAHFTAADFINYQRPQTACCMRCGTLQRCRLYVAALWFAFN